MLLEIYITLISICFILLFIAKYYDADIIKLSAFTLLFLLSCVLLFGSVETKSGETHTVVGNTTTITDTYTAITKSSTFFGTVSLHTYAFILAILSVFGFVFVLAERGRNDD